MSNMEKRYRRKMIMMMLIIISVAIIIITSSLGSIRLADGPVPNAGRVEIYSGGVWYTVSDRSFYQQEAQVVCAQLGYQR